MPVYFVYSEFVLLANPPADLVTPVRVTNTLTTAKLSSLILAHGLVLAYVVLIVALIIHIFLVTLMIQQKH